jgi:hypothetical protein
MWVIGVSSWQKKAARSLGDPNEWPAAYADKMRHKMPIARIHHDIGFAASAIRGACYGANSAAHARFMADGGDNDA